ncbi:ATP-binding protein [Pseudomonas typographi]|uniref:ATP-binding protein n=1 Tax=Pseudomonas typographi TaxID=2715964 RepID=UPI001685670E|nr:ATP-binding protein [Pseudomonas typographi]MBD1553607.1 ATP-binding protein [Pseudomonas typographi]
MADQISNFCRQPVVISNDWVTDECPEHGTIVRREVEQFDGTYLHMPCVKCRWEGINREPQNSEKHKAAVASKMAERINAFLIGSGITPRFRDCTLDNYRTDDEPEKARALAECRAYVEHFENNYHKGRSMILSGNIGTGKTHLGSAMVQVVIRQLGARALIASIAEIVRVAKGTMAKGASYTESDVINELANVDLLIIDEVGVQRGSEYELGILHEVLDRRYQLVIPTVVISNLPVDELKAYMGDRALDRLRQGGGKAVGFTWGSERAKA